MPTPNFCAWEAIRDQVAATLHVAPASLPSEWNAICSHAARRAAAELRSIFILKGYTPAQLSQWSDGFTYSQQLGTWFAITAGSSLCGYDTKNIEWMDCRKELREAAALIIGEEAVAPSGSSDVGGISSGVIDAIAEQEDDAEDRGLFR